jgi:NAD-dependent deacetylase
VLTGAGVSAESGVPTFRAAGGLWEKYPIEKVASPEGFRADPALVWRFYSERRSLAKTRSPNPGHTALVELERRLGDRFLLATQNVDDLHGRAGSERMVELHGNLFKTRCSRCDRSPFRDEEIYVVDADKKEVKLPACDRCQALLRPHIVWFGEMLDPADMDNVSSFMRRAASSGRFVFIAAGTSGVVYPAAGFVDAARRFGAETWLINAEPAENTSRFQHFVEGPSGKVLPELFQFT